VAPSTSILPSGLRPISLRSKVTSRVSDFSERLKTLTTAFSFIRKGVNVNGFVESIERSLRVEPLQPLVSLHGLLVGFPNFRVSFASYSEVTAGGGIPPECEGVLVIVTKVNVNIEGVPISEVIIVQTNSFAIKEVPKVNTTCIRRPKVHQGLPAHANSKLA